MTNITVRKETFLLSDYRSCPDDIDFLMYTRVISKYEELSEQGMPAVEDIFDEIQTHLIKDIYKEIRGKVAKDNPEKTKNEINEMTTHIASEAVFSMESGIEEEIMLILKRKDLCYKSFSMRDLGDDFGVINNPQQDLIMSLQEGSGLYGYYAED